MSRLLDGLNPSQKKAVMHTDGPLLIIAGPGSGKTRTVVHSIAYAIENRRVLPSRIVAFTFTRKAAKELKDRVSRIVGENIASNIWISTFHSFCGKVLHQDVQQLNIGDRQEFTVNELTRLYNEGPRGQIEYLQHHRFAEPEDVLRFINECRASDIPPDEVASYAQNRHISQAYVEIYQRYSQLPENDEINYSECQLLTNALFRDVPEVRERWQEKFDLIFVDEYQDTDPIQYRIIKFLAERHKNLRVVGDDDQGIYGFRGADIQNILNFEEDYRNDEVNVTSLGQNYRSTPQIVEASSALAEFNPDRREKELFTRNPEGEKIKHLHTENHETEAAAIADFIQRARQSERRPRDFAVLYRTNKQAETFTEAFRELEIPYHVVGNSSNRDTDGVSLMTIHKAKGLEFPNVFVAGVCTSLLPFHNSNEKDWGEELRLLYVVMTRAKNWLCLSSYEEDAQYPRGKSQFLDYIPATLVESVETLENIRIPPRPEEMMPIVTEEPSDYVEPLPEQLLGDGMTVIGVDPGNVGAWETNVGWSVTQKTSDGYSVLRFGTETPTGTPENKFRQIEQKIKALIQSPSIRPHAIAVERLEVATEEARKEWFLYVAACVATVRSIADKEGIECRLYTPQHVKEAATNNRNASKRDVQEAVKRMCNNLHQIPEPHHSADAIATSLCYLRSYLNSSRFEGNKRKEEIYNSGIEHLDNQKCSEAIAKFNEAINIDPVDAEIYCGLGRAYLAQGNLNEAENAAKKALGFRENNHPESQKLLDAIRHYRSGCNFLDNREWNMAIDKFQEAINREPIFTDAHYGLGRVHLAQGNLDEAENAAKKALGLTKNNHPDSQKLLDAIQHYRSGCNSLNNREWDRAINKFKEVINREPIFIDAYCGLGRVHLAQGNLNEAENLAKETIRLDSSYQPALELLERITQAYYNRGCNHLVNQQYGKAITEFNEVVSRNSSFTDAYCSLANAYLRQGSLGYAENYIQEALKLDSSYQPALQILESIKQKYCELARGYLNQDNLAKVENYANKALRLDKNYQPAYQLLSEIKKAHFNQAKEYFSLGNILNAEKSARETLRLDNNDSSAYELLNFISQEYYNQGLASIMEGKQSYYSSEVGHIDKNSFDNAIKLLQKALDTSLNENKNIYANLGRAYYWIDNYDQAVNCYQKVINLDPQDKNAHINLGNAYYRIGAYAKAINPLQKAKDLDLNCAKTCYYLARIQFKLGNLREAELGVKKALHIVPTYQDALELCEEIEEKRKLIRTDKMVLILEDKFWIDKDLVTNAEYLKFVNSNPQWKKNNINKDSDEDGDYLKHWDGNHYAIGEDDKPVVHVSWYAARAYAQWIEKRLPTAAEWRKAVGDSDLWEWCLDQEMKANSKEPRVYVADIFWAPPWCTRLRVGFRCVRSSME